MGTRNLTCVISNSEYKIAQYGQWDGYPSGQGLTILNFLKTEGNISKLKNKLQYVRFLDLKGIDKELVEKFDRGELPDHQNWFDLYISRDVGGKILENLVTYDDIDIPLRNSLSFAGDSLFCEWCYVVDLDTNTFEVYRGFNNIPVYNGRFRSDDKTLEKSNGYEPVVLLKVFSLSQLPTKEEFLSNFENDRT